MSALVFLGIAAAIAIVGGVAVAVLHRRPETPSDDGVQQFRRIMDALAPDDPRREDDQRDATPGGERR